MKQLILITFFMFIFGYANANLPISGTYELYHSNYTSPSDVFTFSADGKVIGRGFFKNSSCSGTYRMTWDGYLEVTYDGFNGPGSGGGCHNFSWTIDVGEAELNQMNFGEDAVVITRAIRFNNAPKNGVLKRVITIADLVGSYKAKLLSTTLTMMIRQDGTIVLSEYDTKAKIRYSIHCYTTPEEDTLWENNVLQSNMSCSVRSIDDGYSSFEFLYTVDFNSVLNSNQFQVLSTPPSQGRTPGQKRSILFRKMKMSSDGQGVR